MTIQKKAIALAISTAIIFALGKNLWRSKGFLRLREGRELEGLDTPSPILPAK
jgi:hypothetical protein